MKDVNTGNISKCCNASMKTVGMPDFIGSNEICTMHWECDKCHEACDPQIEQDHVPDTGKKVEPTDYVHKDKIKKVLKELHGGGNARRLLTRLLDE